MQENSTAETGNLRQKFDALPMPTVSSADIASMFSASAEDAGGKSLMARIKDWVSSKNLFGTYVNDHTGLSIMFNKGSSDSVAAHRAGPQKIALMEVVPDLIETGIRLEVNPGKTRGTLEHIFAAKAVIDGKPHAVCFVARDDGTGNRYYDHNITKIKALDQIDGQAPTSARDGVPQIGPQKESAEDSSVMASGGTSASERSLSNILKKHLKINA